MHKLLVCVCLNICLLSEQEVLIFSFQGEQVVCKLGTYFLLLHTCSAHVYQALQLLVFLGKLETCSSSSSSFRSAWTKGSSEQHQRSGNPRTLAASRRLYCPHFMESLLTQHSFIGFEFSSASTSSSSSLVVVNNLLKTRQVSSQLASQLQMVVEEVKY